MVEYTVLMTRKSATLSSSVTNIYVEVELMEFHLIS